MIGEIFLCVVNRTLMLQLRVLSQEHISLYQVRIMMFGRYKSVLLSIKSHLDLHPNWMIFQVDIENIFNNIYHIFQKLKEVENILAGLILSMRIF